MPPGLWWNLRCCTPEGKCSIDAVCHCMFIPLAGGCLFGNTTEERVAYLGRRPDGKEPPLGLLGLLSRMFWGVIRGC
jgi:hypothetical protein